MSFSTTRDQLTGHLQEAGQILDVFIPTDRASGRPRGFAFVEFASPDEAAAAIASFDGSELDGRNLRINAADNRPRRGGGPPPPPPRLDPPPFAEPRKRGKGSRRGIRSRKRSL